jgi:hypothetical protein
LLSDARRFRENCFCVVFIPGYISVSTSARLGFFFRVFAG